MASVTKKEKEVSALRKFWKPRRDMPSVEWDPAKNRAKFEFIRGVFQTTDQTLCEYLLEKGYIEITDEVETPPVKPPLDDLPDPNAPRDIPDSVIRRGLGKNAQQDLPSE